MILKPPDDGFLPIKQYRKRFGSPSRPALKKLGHKKVTIRGVQGVMFPPDDPDQPWKAFAGLGAICSPCHGLGQDFNAKLMLLM
eukprot:888682-Pyramimonas_sp.AAC.1